MRTTVVLAATLFALSLIGCTAPSASPEAPAAPVAAEPAPAQPAPTPPAPPATPEPATPPVAEPAPGSVPALSKTEGPARTCKTDADCTVKDVGNCCGYFPMCVNKDAKTDPAAVRAQCEKDGMASICGFKEISGCQCVQGTCQDIASGEQVM
jgi:hypothetical protein